MLRVVVAVAVAICLAHAVSASPSLASPSLCGRSAPDQLSADDAHVVLAAPLLRDAAGADATANVAAVLFSVPSTHDASSLLPKDWCAAPVAAGVDLRAVVTGSASDTTWSEATLADLAVRMAPGAALVASSGPSAAVTAVHASLADLTAALPHVERADGHVLTARGALCHTTGSARCINATRRLVSELNHWLATLEDVLAARAAAPANAPVVLHFSLTPLTWYAPSMSAAGFKDLLALVAESIAAVQQQIDAAGFDQVSYGVLVGQDASPISSSVMRQLSDAGYVKDRPGYQISFWVTVLLIVALLMSTCYSLNMDIGEDSIVYRATSSKPKIS